MMRIVVLCCLILFSSLSGFAINAIPSHTIFYTIKGNSAKPYLELYWQVDANTVQFKKDSNQIWTAKLKTELTISCDTGIITQTKYLLKTTPANSLKAALLQNIMDIHRCFVPDKDIYYTLTLTDEDNSSSVYSITDTITIKQEKAGAFYSGIQFVDTAYKSDLTQTMFYKNGNLHVPLCINFLDEHRTLLHYYFELYQTSSINDSLYPLTQEVTISKKLHENTVLDLINTDTIKKPALVYPTLSQLRIDVLPSGNYYLNTNLKDNKGRSLTKQAIFFQRSNPKPTILKDTTNNDTTQWQKVNAFDLGKTFINKYNTAQLKAILKMMLPISTKLEEINIEMFLSEPDDTHMRYFIYNFWNERQKGDAGKAWDRYAKKVREVNKLFGSKNKPGYVTDRGFYYLKYGAPDNRITAYNEQGAHPYEVWVYNSPGKQSTQGILLFYSPGFLVNEFELLHTTIIGETRNTAWRSFLYKAGQSSNNLNSRAEQLIGNN